MDGFYSANDYFRKRFGEKVYKLALDGGMTCPNRADGSGGCIFCSEGGSGDFAEPYTGNVSEQIERAKRRVSAKISSGKYIAYFQSYTNTFAPVERLKALFYPAIGEKSVVALSIATRPDCLPDDVLALLCELNKIKPVFVELGLQTASERTARLINRGYPLSVYDEAVKNLHAVGVEVVTHLILGLPEEDRETVLNSVKYIGERTDGIKLQLLHVLEGTKLAERYERGEYRPLTFEDYVSLVCDCLEALPKHIVVHRVTGDAPKRSLLAPLWSADKKRVLNAVSQELARRRQEGI